LIYHQFSKENNRRCAEFQIAEGRILGRAERANGDASNLKQLHYSYLEFPTELCIALTNSSMMKITHPALLETSNCYLNIHPSCLFLLMINLSLRPRRFYRCSTKHLDHSRDSGQVSSTIPKQHSSDHHAEPSVAHAKGQMLRGTFTPTPEAKTLSKAPHFQNTSTPVLVRFSDSTGLPEIPDFSADARPNGIAVRFDLGTKNNRRWHTDVSLNTTKHLVRHPILT
jgi:hypothetical protein